MIAELEALLLTPVPVPLGVWLVLLVWCAARALRWEMWA
jgi:hypothetical protein